MNTKKESDPASIVVVPSAAKYAYGIEQLQAEAYGCSPIEWDDTISAAKALTHLNIFPEGQYVALDTATDKVIGMTVCMQIGFNPEEPFLEPWTTTTDYG